MSLPSVVEQPSPVAHAASPRKKPPKLLSRPLYQLKKLEGKRIHDRAAHPKLPGWKPQRWRWKPKSSVIGVQKKAARGRAVTVTLEHQAFLVSREWEIERTRRSPGAGAGGGSTVEGGVHG